MHLPLIGIISREGGGGGGVTIEAYQYSAYPTPTSTTIDMIAPSGITSGEILVIFIASFLTAGTYTTPAGWTLAGYKSSVAIDSSIAVFYKVSDGTETDVTVTAPLSKHMGWYMRVSGASATPIDVSGFGGNNTAAASFAVASVTTTVDDCLVIYGLGFAGGDGYPFSVSGTGWSETDEQQFNGTDSNSPSACFGTKEQATAGGTGDATVAASASRKATHFQLAIAPA